MCGYIRLPSNTGSALLKLEFPPTVLSMSPTTPYVQSGEPLNDFLRSFWQRQVDAAEQETPDYRHPPLPLARIKKVMKSDPDVKVCPSWFIKRSAVLLTVFSDDCSRCTYLILQSM